MWELDHKEGWVLKNWCFRTVVLEKTLEHPMDSKEIKIVNPKGSQPWIFIGRTDVKAEAPILWSLDVKWKSLSRVWLFATSWTIESRNSLGQNTGVGSLSLFQGIFPTQGSNTGLWNWRRILYQLSHKGSPRILEWVAFLFSSRSSWPRNQTRVSWIAGGFFINWSMRDVHIFLPSHVLISCL